MLCDQTLLVLWDAECMCASVVTLQEGRCADEQIIGSGWDSDVCVSSSLVDMYTKCGIVEDA
jgi:hypothetical protein